MSGGGIEGSYNLVAERVGEPSLLKSDSTSIKQGIGINTAL